MGVSFETKYEREFTELQKDETGGLPKEKFEKLYKNNKPSIRYFLYRAYGLMKKANEAFAVLLRNSRSSFRVSERKLPKNPFLIAAPSE